MLKLLNRVNTVQRGCYRGQGGSLGRTKAIRYKWWRGGEGGAGGEPVKQGQPNPRRSPRVPWYNRYERRLKRFRVIEYLNKPIRTAHKYARFLYGAFTRTPDAWLVKGYVSRDGCVFILSFDLPRKPWVLACYITTRKTIAPRDLSVAMRRINSKISRVKPPVCDITYAIIADGAWFTIGVRRFAAENKILLDSRGGRKVMETLKTYFSRRLDKLLLALRKRGPTVRGPPALLATILNVIVRSLYGRPPELGEIMYLADKLETGISIDSLAVGPPPPPGSQPVG